MFINAHKKTMSDHDISESDSDISDASDYETQESEEDYDEGDDRMRNMAVPCAQHEYDANGGKWSAEASKIRNIVFKDESARLGQELSEEIDFFVSLMQNAVEQ